MVRSVSNGATKAFTHPVYNKTQPKIGQAISGAVAVALELAKTSESI